MAGYARVSVRQPLCGKQNSNMALNEQNKLLKDKLQLNAEYLNIDLKLNRKIKYEGAHAVCFIAGTVGISVLMHLINFRVA